MKNLEQHRQTVRGKCNREDRQQRPGRSYPRDVMAMLTALVLLFMLTGCGNNLGRLYPDNTDAAKHDRPLSERIAEWEKFRLPGLRDDGAESPGDNAALAEEAAAIAVKEEAAAQLQATRYSETVEIITGDWSELSEALPLFRPIVSWFGTLTILEDGSYSSGTGSGTWELNPECTQLTLLGSRGKTLIDILNDGGYAKLCAPELHLNFLRSNELNNYIDERFVSVELTKGNVNDYIAKPRNIGIIPDEKKKPTNENAWVLSSNAYKDGLIYYGRSEDFQIRIQNTAGEDRTAILPYDTLSLVNWASFGSITQAKGTLVFIRAEYVADNRMTDARTRTLTLSDGTTHTTSMTWYTDLANYTDWIF